MARQSKCDPIAETREQQKGDTIHGTISIYVGPIENIKIITNFH